MELRKLYIDEFYTFYEFTIKVLEEQGKIKKGTYSKVSGESDVSKLKKQLFKINK